MKLYNEIKESTTLERYDISLVMNEMRNDKFDFDFGEYRFIAKDYIDDILKEELGSATCLLGFFDVCFLADTLDMPVHVIELLQQHDAHEAIGDIILHQNKLSELAEEYTRLDGYGHHFSHYDGSESIAGNYYVFKIE